MRKNILKISMCFAFSLLIIAILYLNSRHLTNDNGFRRNYKQNNLKNLCLQDLTHNSFYIAGSDYKSLYLGNYMTPDLMLIINTHNLDMDTVKLNFLTNKHMTKPEMFIRVDSPYVYLFYGKHPLILRGKIQDQKLTEYIVDGPKFYSHFGFPLSNSSLVVKTYDSNKQQYTLSKISENPTLIINNPKSIEKQLDGIFCTEGLVSYQKKNLKLVFTYAYRNAYTILDTNLNITAKGQTIDTNTRVKIQLEAVRSDQQIVMAKPPLFVNLITALDQQVLYVKSKLKASNENYTNYNQNTIIDAYDLNDQFYKYSFYIPNINDKRVSDMVIANNHLFVIQGQYLSKYQLSTVP